jgi:hypothetical protein
MRLLTGFTENGFPGAHTRQPSHMGPGIAAACRSCCRPPAGGGSRPSVARLPYRVDPTATPQGNLVPARKLVSIKQHPIDCLTVFWQRKGQAMVQPGPNNRADLAGYPRLARSLEQRIRRGSRSASRRPRKSPVLSITKRSVVGAGVIYRTARLGCPRDVACAGR